MINNNASSNQSLTNQSLETKKIASIHNKQNIEQFSLIASNLDGKTHTITNSSEQLFDLFKTTIPNLELDHVLHFLKYIPEDMSNTSIQYALQHEEPIYGHYQQALRHIVEQSSETKAFAEDIKDATTNITERQKATQALNSSMMNGSSDLFSDASKATLNTINMQSLFDDLKLINQEIADKETYSNASRTKEITVKEFDSLRLNDNSGRTIHASMPINGNNFGLSLRIDEEPFSSNEYYITLNALKDPEALTTLNDEEFTSLITHIVTRFGKLDNKIDANSKIFFTPPSNEAMPYTANNLQVPIAQLEQQLKRALLEKNTASDLKISNIIAGAKLIVGSQPFSDLDKLQVSISDLDNDIDEQRKIAAEYSEANTRMDIVIRHGFGLEIFLNVEAIDSNKALDLALSTRLFAKLITRLGPETVLNDKKTPVKIISSPTAELKSIDSYAHALKKELGREVRVFNGKH